MNMSAIILGVRTLGKPSNYSYFCLACGKVNLRLLD